MSKKRIILILLTISLSFIALWYLLPAKKLKTNYKIDKIIILKNKHKLNVYSGKKLLKTYKISIGKGSKGKKDFEGDKKTPEGIYYINDKNPHSSYYLNLGISYPNKDDIEYAKKHDKSPGGLIKIHGIKNGFGFISKFHRFFDWTLGCIAVTNKEMKELYDNVPVGTIIEIKK